MIAGIQTSTPPLHDPRFQAEMLERGIALTAIPRRLSITNQSFPATQAAMAAMKKAGYRPVFSR